MRMLKKFKKQKQSTKMLEKHKMFCLKKLIRNKIKRIQSKLHRIYMNFIGTYKVCKIFLSCFDDKRSILGDGINSLAYSQKDT